jgi:hypothetical protein
MAVETGVCNWQMSLNKQIDIHSVFHILYFYGGNWYYLFGKTEINLLLPFVKLLHM